MTVKEQYPNLTFSHSCFLSVFYVIHIATINKVIVLVVNYLKIHIFFIIKNNNKIIYVLFFLFSSDKLTRCPQGEDLF
jgi:hypothetical protein